MKNAHLRMGSLQFTKMLHDTTIDITVHMDRMIAERDAVSRSARCHLLSVIGNDQEIAAIAAAISDEARFYADGPEVSRLMITLGEDAEVFRSSISIPGRRRPLRHLVAISEELSKTRAGGNGYPGFVGPRGSMGSIHRESGDECSSLTLEQTRDRCDSKKLLIHCWQSLNSLALSSF